MFIIISANIIYKLNELLCIVLKMIKYKKIFVISKLTKKVKKPSIGFICGFTYMIIKIII